MKSSAMFDFSDLTTLAILGAIFATVNQYLTTYRYWKRKGINGPTPWPFFGNAIQIFFAERRTLLAEWQRKYGKVFGVYQGSRPYLFVGDAEVAQQICIKDFDVFPNHSARSFLNKYEVNFLFHQRDNHWRKVRALTSPTFTSGKIKRMFKLLDACADDLIMAYRERLDQDKSTELNVKDVYHLYTMDAIATCCYGLKLEQGRSSRATSEFVKVAGRFFDFSFARFLILALVPEHILKKFSFKLKPKEQIEPLAGVTSKIIETRRKSPKKFDDYLQLLLETRLENPLELTEMDSEENHHASLTEKTLIDDQQRMVDLTNAAYKPVFGSKISLTDMEVLSAAMFLLSVGLETTGSLLTHCTYALAFHQQIQDRLYEELSKICEYNADTTQYGFSYEAITSCRYLDAVISETLRLLSPIPMIDREANQDYSIEKLNLKLPRGSRLMINFYGIHLTSEYWSEPLKFNPDRFMPENKDKIVPGSYLPFGLGPRHCLGMRFSLTEAKLALAKMIMNFRFQPARATSFPPFMVRKPQFNNIDKPRVAVSRRDGTI